MHMLNAIAPSTTPRRRRHHAHNAEPRVLLTRPAVEPAARGCMALLGRRHPAAGTAQLQEAQALEIIRAAASGVHVQSLAQPERYACLSLWLAALQVRATPPTPRRPVAGLQGGGMTERAVHMTST
jgi:hypothetical protein